MGEPLFVGPTHADFDLTVSCNLGCTHCHSSSGQKLPNELTTPEILRVIDELHELGVMTLTFAGGEPFAHPDALEILSYACALPGWRVSVITNGTYLSEELLNAIMGRCEGLALSVSVEGSTPEVFGELRQMKRASSRSTKRLFELVVQRLRTAVAIGFPVQTSFTVSGANLHDLERTYALVVEDIGAASMVAIKFVPAGYGLSHLEKLDVTPTRWAVLLERLTRLKLRGELSRLRLSIPSAWEFYLPLAEAQLNLEECERVWGYRSPLQDPVYAAYRDIGDPAGVTMLCVGADGVIYPSILMSGTRAAAAGNVRDSSIADLWQTGPPFVKLRQLVLAAVDHRCAACGLAGICGGGSRARALSLAGSIVGPDVGCPQLAGSPSASPRQ